MKTGGSARLAGFEEYIRWYSQLSLEEADAVCEKLSDLVKALEKENKDAVTNCIKNMFSVRSWASYPQERTREFQWPNVREGNVGRLAKFRAFAEEFDQTIRVALWEEGTYAYLYLGNPNSGIVVLQPEKYLEYVPDVDYSDMTPLEVQRALGASDMTQDASLFPVDAGRHLTKSGVEELLKGQNEALDSLLKEIDDVKGAKSGELAELQAEIKKMQAELDAKKSALMAELQEKMAAMEEIKERLENQIYLLDSQIYSIRCYAGEVINFAKIRSGKNAPDTSPVIIHQKLRFLDEELGLLASLYEIRWGELGMFEDFLKHSPLALETFAPNDRCVTLVRLSRSAKLLGRDAENSYSNMLDEYEYYHGRTVGIIIRNGENLYLGWTDEERVHIDDDLIVSRVVTEIEPAEEEPKFTFESERKRFIKEQKQKRRKIADGLISRAFVYNILQGVVDHSAILPLPAGIKLNKPSEYVIYSVADKWLTDDRYGGFTEIVKRCNERVVKGDMLLTVQSLVPEHEKFRGGCYYGHDRAWDNARGRGDANRTHDCSVDDCTIYPANLVEYDDPVNMTRFRKWVEADSWVKQKNPEAKPHWFESEMPTKEFARYVEQWPSDRVEVIDTYDYREAHVFVSVKKTDCYRWDGYLSDARANFELYPTEYINLTYLNSVWLEWVITNKKLGGWAVGGKPVDYAYAIRYLKTAMDFVREREAEEKQLIAAVSPAIVKDPEWPVKLSEWKIKNRVRNITEYQAKRFARDVLI